MYCVTRTRSCQCIINPWINFFETIEDNRHHNKRHKPIDIIIIAICGVVAGADTYEQIENFGKKRKRWLLKFLELPYGIPSHDSTGLRYIAKFFGKI